MLIVNRYILLLWVKNTALTFFALLLLFHLVDGFSQLAQLQAKGFEPKLVWVMFWVSNWRVMGQIIDFSVGLGTLFTLAILNYNREWAMLLCSGYKPETLARLLGSAAIVFGCVYGLALQPIFAPYASVEQQVRESIMSQGDYTLKQSGQNVWLRHKTEQADSWVHAQQWLQGQRLLQNVTMYTVDKGSLGVAITRCQRVEYQEKASLCDEQSFAMNQWDIETQLLSAESVWLGNYPSVIVQRHQLGQTTLAHWARLLELGFKPMIWMVICRFAVLLGSQPTVRRAGIASIPLLAIVLSGSYLLQQLLKAQVESGTISPLLAIPIYTILIWLAYRSEQKKLA